MTTITLEIVNPTPASVTLTNIVVVDTGAALVQNPPLPQTMTKNGSTFTYGPFEDSSPGAIYNLFFTITWQDGSTLSVQQIYPATSPMNPGNSYFGYNDMVQVFGPYNIQQWSQLDNTGQNTSQINWLRIQYALNYVYSEVNLFVSRGPYSLPISPVPPAFTVWCATIGGSFLYETRGDKTGEHGQPIAKFKRLRDEAWKKISMYLTNTAKSLGAGQAWPQPTAPSTWLTYPRTPQGIGHTA